MLSDNLEETSPKRSYSSNRRNHPEKPFKQLTIQATLCFILRDDKVLLLKKSKGLFGQDKWSAPGGKMLPGEEAEYCAVREVLEETQLAIKNPEQVGILHFYKNDRRENPDWTVHVFLSRTFKGIPVRSREGQIRWFDANSLPLEDMWEDDRYWSRLALEGRRFEGWFYYSGDFENLVDYRIEEDRPLAPVKV